MHGIKLKSSEEYIAKCDVAYIVTCAVRYNIFPVIGRIIIPRVLISIFQRQT
jgi:hypothetical protein